MLKSAIGTKCNSENSQINVIINGKKLNQISETKLLEIHIDENLTWKTQCSAISRKLSKKFGLMKRLRSILPLNIISVTNNPNNSYNIMDLVQLNHYSENVNCGLLAPLKSFAATPREATCHETTTHVLSLLLLRTCRGWTCLFS